MGGRTGLCLPRAMALTAPGARAPPGEGTRDPAHWVRQHRAESPEPVWSPPSRDSSVSESGPHLFTPILTAGEDSWAGTGAKCTAKAGRVRGGPAFPPGRAEMTQTGCSKIRLKNYTRKRVKSHRV